MDVSPPEGCDVLKRLVNCGKDAEFLTELTSAVNSEDPTQILIAANTDVNLRGDKGITPLMLAAKLDSNAAVDALITVGALVNAVSNLGYTALTLAAGTGSINSMKVLIEAKADLEVRDNEGRTALLHAAIEGQTNAISTLLEARANVDAINDRGWTALWLASTGAAADALITARADVYARDKVGSTVLMNAASKGRLDVVRALLAAGARVSDRNYSGETALLSSLQNTDVSAFQKDIIEALLAADADVRCVDRKNETILHYGARNRNVHISTLELLLNARAPVNHQNFEGKTALDIAVEKNTMEKVQLLISRGADLDIRDHEGMTPLVRSARNLNTAAVQALLAAGARWHVGYQSEIETFGGICRRGSFYEHFFDSKDMNQQKRMSESIKIMELLIEAKADLNPKQRTQMPLIASAAAPDKLRLLLKAGVDVNCRGARQQTALMAAVTANMRESVQLLLDAKADVNLLDNSKATASRIAVESKDAESLKLLLSVGAQIDVGYSKEESPLATALTYPTCTILQVLLNAKADVNRLTQHDTKSLAEAVSNTKIVAIHMLVKAGLDLSSPNVSADVVSAAVREGNVDMLRILLEGKADVNFAAEETEKSRESALRIALKSDWLSMQTVEALLDAGARVEDCGFDEGSALACPTVLENVRLLKMLLRVLCEQTGYLVPLENPQNLNSYVDAIGISDREESSPDQDSDSFTDDGFGSESDF